MGGGEFSELSYIFNYSSLNKVTKWLVTILAIEIIVSLVTLVSDAYQIRILNSILNYEYDYSTALNLAQASDLWQSIIAGIGLVVEIASVVIFLYWFYRAYRNLSSLGANELEFNPKWVVAYFFIPILGLWKPLRALEEIWTVSTSDNSTSRTKSSYILVVWWCFHIIVNFLGFTIARSFFTASTPEELINSNHHDMVLQILIIVADMLFIFIAKEIFSKQELKSHGAPTIH